MKLLILNASPSGARGNCAALIRKLPSLSKNIKFQVVHLARTPYGPALRKQLLQSDALLIVTGTYWDSWGSPLQKFLEDATDLEAHPSLVGKSAGVVVLMHSVGGKGILSRLQGVLSTFGFLLPPFSGMTLSLAGQIATESKSEQADDFWCADDLNVIVQNLRTASEKSENSEWKVWPVDRENFRKTWIK